LRPSGTKEVSSEHSASFGAQQQQTKVNKMKTLQHTWIKVSLFACAIFGLALAARAAEGGAKPIRGGELLAPLSKIETKAQADALKPDDTMVMICGKCKTVYVTRVRQGAKGAEILMAQGQPKELIGTHACAGCSSTIEVTGHGRGKETVLKHSCKACGDDSAFCCATKPGGAATKGMEKERK
jgi:ribosomal protein L44E